MSKVNVLYESWAASRAAPPEAEPSAFGGLMPTSTEVTGPLPLTNGHREQTGEPALDWTDDSREPTSAESEPPGSGPSDLAALDLGTYTLYQRLTRAETMVGELQQELHLRRRREELLIADACLSELGLFILDRLAWAEDSIPLVDVEANLKGAHGWIAIARLMRAGLVDEDGLSLYLTKQGQDLRQELMDGRIGGEG